MNQFLKRAMELNDSIQQDETELENLSNRKSTLIKKYKGVSNSLSNINNAINDILLKFNSFPLIRF